MESSPTQLIKDNDHIFVCRHCNEEFVVNRNDFNCMILRHGVYRNNMNPISPHAPREECDMLYENNMIFGCGKPLKIIPLEDGNFDVIICDYI